VGEGKGSYSSENNKKHSTTQNQDSILIKNRKNTLTQLATQPYLRGAAFSTLSQ